MSDAKKKTRSWHLVIPVGCALLAGMFSVSGVRADAGPGMSRLQYGHGRAMQYRQGGVMDNFAGHALHGLLLNQQALGLSDEQTSKIKAIAVDYAKSRIQGEADVKLAELDVRTRMFDQQADLSSIESALRKSERARTTLRLDGVKAFRAATAVLTPEQREKWHQSKRRGMMLRGGSAMGERGHGGGPEAAATDPPETED